MTELEKLLQNWNNGVLRGAKIRLARELNVDDSTVSAWVAGRANPPADKIEKISKLFKISEKEVKNAFGFENKNDHNMVEGRIELEYIPVRGISSATEEKFILEETETYLPFRKTGPNQFVNLIFKTVLYFSFFF